MEGHAVNMANRDDEASKSPQESRRLSIQRCIQSLVHACLCRNTNCSLPSCQKMKRVVKHTKACKRKTNRGCPICKQLIALCCFHAKHCQENKCPVPFCLNIKHKLRQLQAKMMRRRRMATMQGRVMPLPSPPASSTPSTPPPPPIHDAPRAAAATAGPEDAGSSAARCPATNSAETRQPNALQQQQQHVLNILRSNPKLMAAFIKQRTAKYQRLQQALMVTPPG